MNARINYFILFGFCLAVFSSSALASSVLDPYGRLGSLSAQPLQNVRVGNPYHFARVPPSITSVPAANQTLGGKFTNRFTSPNFLRAFNVSSLIRYSQASAGGALRGCLASGPACFGGAALGAGVGLGIDLFLTNYGYSVGSAGSIISSNEIDAVVSGSCIQAHNTNYSANGCSFSGGGVGSVFTPQPRPSTISDYILGQGDVIAYSRGVCNRPSATGIITCSGATNWELREYQGRYYYVIAYTWWTPSTYAYGERRWFATSYLDSPDSPLSSVVNETSAGSSVDLSSVLDRLDFSSYVPDSTDFSVLASNLSEYSPSYIEFDPIPDYLGVPSVSTVTNNGVVTKTTTTPSYSFDVRNNASSSPEIVVTESTQVVVEVNGNVQSDTVTDVEVLPPPTTGINPDTGLPYPPTPPSAGQAYDCWSFQFICDWFAWTQDVPDVSIDQLNLDELKTESEIEYIQRSVNVGAPATCPAGQSLDLGHFGEYSVSYDPFCELAETSKPLFLTFMSLLSIFIVYRAFSS